MVGRANATLLRVEVKGFILLALGKRFGGPASSKRGFEKGFGLRIGVAPDTVSANLLT